MGARAQDAPDARIGLLLDSEAGAHELALLVHAALETHQVNIAVIPHPVLWLSLSLCGSRNASSIHKKLDTQV
jgi:hypothetical protein